VRTNGREQESEDGDREREREREGCEELTLLA
jgi:hypothetical protein